MHSSPLLQEKTPRPSRSDTMATPKDATKLVLETLLKHTAECFETLVAIIADKYGHDANEMMEVVAGDARWTGIQQPALLKALGEYVPPATASPAPATPAVTTTEPKKIVKRVVKLKKPTPSVSTAPPPSDN